MLEKSQDTQKVVGY